jgi:hypothetical protein
VAGLCAPTEGKGLAVQKEKGGRGKKSAAAINGPETGPFSKQRLSDARSILEFSPELAEAGRMARAVHTELQTQIHIINAISANPPATHPATFNNIFPNTPSSAGMKFCVSVLRHSPELAKSVFAGMPMSGYYELEESRAFEEDFPPVDADGEDGSGWLRESSQSLKSWVIASHWPI